MTKTRSILAALFAVLIAASTGAPVRAQQQQQRDEGEPRADAPQTQPDNQRGGPDAEGEGGDDEGALPFNMDRLFVPRWRLADGPQVKAAFRDVIPTAAAATVAIKCDGKRRGLGGVVGADGWILTKATPLCGTVTCTLPDGRELPGTTVGESHEYDLALVKVDAQDLPTLDLSDVTVPPVGAWLATVGMDRDPVAVGVVSVGPREIPPQAGVLGVMLDQTAGNQPIVEQVFKESAAESAGVKVGDRIVSVDGVATRTRQELIERVRTFSPGDEVTLAIERGSEKVTLRATLGGAFPIGIAGRSEFQNNLGGRLSVRRFGFPVALQHDAVLQPDECGGPVVDLDGRVIGFNIARAGRTESYAIPTGAVRDVIAELLEDGMAAATKSQKSGNGEKKLTTSTPTSTPVAAPAAPPAPNDAKKPRDNQGAASGDAPSNGDAADDASAYADEGYRLVWSDEFNVDGRPDAEKWDYEHGLVRNDELQWYQSDNARCDGGLLVIEARKERVENPHYDADSSRWPRNVKTAEYTSASLCTAGKASWKYGRFEMRGRIDVRPGLWPAFWTLGDGGRWPTGGEIDVMEYYRGTLLANVAWADRRGRAKWDDSRTPLADLGGDDWASKFHVWRMDWDKDRIALSVDGRVLNETDLTQTINETDDGENPFHAPHYLILNLALGGTNGGDPRNTDFPAKFEVDYVRVYQR